MGIISITQAVDLLKAGKPVALPTETVYGLAAPISNLNSIKEIFKIKKRPFNDPLIVHVSSLEMASELVEEITPDIKTLADTFWPGPLTLVLKKNNKKVDDLITSGEDTVAIRIPKSKLFLKAIEEVGPLAAPSANLFKKISPSKANHVIETLPGVDVVDGGSCDVGIESTIFSVEDLSILRPGMISISEIAQSLNKTISNKTKEKTPGFEEDHYQPNTEVVVYTNENKFTSFLKKKTHIPLNLNPDPNLTASSLYSFLRELDNKADYISIKWDSLYENEKWMGIKNRLEKASSYWIS